jgi:hypothetical protein
MLLAAIVLVAGIHAAAVAQEGEARAAEEQDTQAPGCFKAYYGVLFDADRPGYLNCTMTRTTTNVVMPLSDKYQEHTLVPRGYDTSVIRVTVLYPARFTIQALAPGYSQLILPYPEYTDTIQLGVANVNSKPAVVFVDASSSVILNVCYYATGLGVLTIPGPIDRDTCAGPMEFYELRLEHEQKIRAQRWWESTE